eukprot:CAMPEP_0184684902 /NCGR_PEP_ID=MMETSP0312-20130426/17076_1 /TAXON_ID=31354 /ORGANISM="Compsopogon coeruleus, Strain SAG 36.94" /LENGTH=66 /DNA_ID=CAMNT_0027138531 /DNA_START=66 /DNA_END=262 /DNA_ORIENTATION=-
MDVSGLGRRAKRPFPGQSPVLAGSAPLKLLGFLTGACSAYQELRPWSKSPIIASARDMGLHRLLTT